MRNLPADFPINDSELKSFQSNATQSNSPTKLTPEQRNELADTALKLVETVHHSYKEAGTMSFFQFQDPIFFTAAAPADHRTGTGRTGPEAAVRFSSTKLIQRLSRSRRSLGKLLLSLRLLGLAALIVALARPQIGKTSDSTEAEGIDIVLTLDLSDP